MVIVEFLRLSYATDFQWGAAAASGVPNQLSSIVDAITTPNALILRGPVATSLGLKITPATFKSVVGPPLEPDGTGYLFEYASEKMGSTVTNDQFGYASGMNIFMNFTKSDQTFVISRTQIMSPIATVSQLSGALSGILGLCVAALGFLEEYLHKRGLTVVGRMVNKEAGLSSQKTQKGGSVDADDLEADQSDPDDAHRTKVTQALANRGRSKSPLSTVSLSPSPAVMAARERATLAARARSLSPPVESTIFMNDASSLPPVAMVSPSSTRSLVSSSSTRTLVSPSSMHAHRDVEISSNSEPAVEPDSTSASSGGAVSLANLRAGLSPRLPVIVYGPTSLHRDGSGKTLSPTRLMSSRTNLPPTISNPLFQGGPAQQVWLCCC